MDALGDAGAVDGVHIAFTHDDHSDTVPGLFLIVGGGLDEQTLGAQMQESEIGAAMIRLRRTVFPRTSGWKRWGYCIRNMANDLFPLEKR